MSIITLTPERTSPVAKKKTAFATKRRTWSNAKPRPVPAEAIREWRATMGWSERDAAERLGIARKALRTAEQEGATLYIGLACAALYHGLTPWGLDPQKGKTDNVNPA